MSFRTAATSTAAVIAQAAVFDEFYADLKKTQARDSKLTSKEQIDRLLRPGHTYFNMNPFEVLQVDPDLTPEEMKKKYKRMSLLCHPDKNMDDRERAQKAFDVLKKASEQIADPDELDRCRNIIKEAVGRLHNTMLDKKKKLKAEGKPTKIDEEDPEKYRHALWVQTQKTWADKERKRRMIEQRMNEEKARVADDVTEMQLDRAMQREYNKNFDDTRGNRMESWQNFTKATSSSSSATKKTTTFKKKSKKPMTMFKPPKTRPEQR